MLCDDIIAFGNSLSCSSFCSLATRLCFVDVPDGAIKKHTKTTPYLGGVAVYFGFLCGIAFFLPLGSSLFLFLMGTTLLVFVGLIDDLLVLKPYQKFLGQIIATVCFLKAGLYLREQFFSNGWNILLSFFWIIGLINAFNLVDVMDGLASVLAIMATINFMFLAVVLGQPQHLVLLGAFLGSVLGFLWYNKPVARIYLGDAGSLFLGGLLSTVPFLFSWGEYTDLGYLTPLIVFGIPLLEVSFLIIIRTYKGIPFYQASPDHFSCYLRGRGWSVEKILLFVFTVSLFFAAVSILFVSNIISFATTFFLGALTLLVWTLVIFGKSGLNRA